MRLILSRAQAEAICVHARDSAPAECCGLLLGDRERGEGVQILPAANVAADPVQRFEIDPTVLLAAHKAARAGGPGILGHYHSHPDGAPVPSPVDAGAAEACGEVWLLVGEEGMRAWRAGPDGALHGCFDEIELIIHPTTSC